MIEARQLTKRFGTETAVSDVSFVVRPGLVTGFVGPNGAGKTTTMRMILGLDRPSGGEVRVSGRRYADLAAPLREVGALIDAAAVHKGRRAVAQLEWMAQTNRIPRSRVAEVLAMVGLDAVGRRRVRSYSLGMAQRLGIAGALLGDPPVLLFDEPINGLDPQGMVWARSLLRALAAEGRTVLVSSHLMSEMALTADRLLVIGRGRIMADSTVDEMVGAHAARSVRVRTADQDRLARRMVELGAGVVADGDGSLTVTGPDSRWVGQLAASEGIVVWELTPRQASLEEAFMHLTGGSIDYVAGPSPAAPPQPWPVPTGPNP